jgi:hypothetical protein
MTVSVPGAATGGLGRPNAHAWAAGSKCSPPIRTHHECHGLLNVAHLRYTCSTHPARQSLRHMPIVVAPT